ncbi:MAG: methyltransferase domain-containing protein [Alphaproteobacteria bacterium]|nr:methyltransferase domain-containing protein [Alphaproteobacteria bacterium]
MTAVVQPKATTSDVNGKLWSAGARDWADIQEGVVRKLYETVLERMRVGRGTRYLDAGCGSGLAAQIAASRGAAVSGIDAAEALLAIARERVPQGDFQRGDLEALPYPERAFDAVTGFNSFQFAGNQAVALGEARRVTKPDGTVAIVTWGEPEGMEAASVVGALRPLMPPPPPGAPGPFALSQQAALRRFAADAKLKPVEIFDVDTPFFYPDQATALRGLNSSGVATRAIEHSSRTVVTEAHAKAIAPFRQADGSYRIQATFRCLLAKLMLAGLLLAGALTPTAHAADRQVARGKYLVTLGGCNDCHTPGSFFGKPDMKRTLGGSDVGFAIPGMGVFVGANLTPDKETGLGTWTKQQIVTALTTGKRPDGRMLAPVMPWEEFAHLTRADALAIAAYLKSLPPVQHKVAGPFGPNEKVTVFVMSVQPADVYNTLPQPGEPPAK